MGKTTLITLFIIVIFLLSSQFASSEIQDIRNIKQKILEDGSANVIIQFEEDNPTVTKGKITLSSSANLKRNNLLNEVKKEIKNTKEFKIINGFSGKLTKEGLKKLEESGTKFSIQEDVILRILPVDNTPNIATDISTRVIGANYTWENLNYTGRNITVAVIDTGIDYNHPDLGIGIGATHKVLGGYDFYNNDTDPMDDEGHGTHVAGTIAANGSYPGVAPDANLLAYKVCSSAGSCPSSVIIQGIEAAVGNDSDIISISIGGPVVTTSVSNTGKDAVSIAANNAVAAGVVVVVAAGNDGSGTSTINQPGAAEDVITVGNLNDAGTIITNDDSIALGSSRGPSGFGRFDPDLSAPGSNIYSLDIGGGYQTLSGTSMATPHVSGAVALLLEYNNSLNPTQIRAILMTSAKNISGKAFEKGAGLLNIANAIQNNAYLQVTGKNTYEQESTNDRWEFVSNLFTPDYANITIYNSNNFTINFTTFIDEFTNLENSITLDTNDFEMPLIMSVPANTETIFQINYSLTNLSQYQTTYGGIIHLQGTGDSDTVNLTLPIAITIPINGDYYGTKSMDDTGSGGGTGLGRGDNFAYAIRKNISSNDTIIINWTLTSNDLDLSVYNSTGGVEDIVGYGTSDNESYVTNTTDLIKWIRSYGFYFVGSPHYFDLNITSTKGYLPELLNVTDLDINTSLVYQRPNNITLIFNYFDLDGDNLTIEINDSRYVLVSQTNYTQSIYYLETNTSCFSNHSIEFNISDNETTTTNIINITLITSLNYPPIQLSYTPLEQNINLIKNETQNFTTNYCDSNNQTLMYYWYINDTLNSTNQNHTFNSTFYNSSIYNISFVVSNNNSNSTIEWEINLSDINNPVIFNSTNNITNKNWSQGLNLTNAINLSEHFYDLDNETPTYTLVNASNVTMQITNNTISFTAPTSFYGLESVWIFANDSESNTTSNIFLLNISQNVAPTIHNVTNESGFENYTFNRTQNITLIINYSDTENNNLIMQINDSNYNIINQSNLSQINYSTYSYKINETCTNNHSVEFNLSDSFNSARFVANITIINPYDYSPILLTYNPVVNQTTYNTSMYQYNSTSCDVNSYNITHQWLINGSENGSSENLSLNLSLIELGTYNITHIISNNLTNISREYTLNIVSNNNGSSPDPAPVQAPSGGGVGGGSRISSPQTYYAQRFEVVENSFEVERESSAAALYSIGININKELENVYVRMKEYSEEEQPETISKLKGIIYKSLNILHENMNDSEINEVNFQFRVSKEWLKVKGINFRNIKLYRYTDEEWTPLETNPTISNSTHYFYESKSPGLSDFVIIAQNSETVNGEQNAEQLSDIAQEIEQQIETESQQSSEQNFRFEEPRRVTEPLDEVYVEPDLPEQDMTRIGIIIGVLSLMLILFTLMITYKKPKRKRERD